jgi:hypothetical protein
MKTLATRRIGEIVGMLAVGDGLIAALEPERHMRLWGGGPAAWDRTVQAFAARPMLTRAVGVAEIGFGAWLMLRQLKGPAR